MGVSGVDGRLSSDMKVGVVEGVDSATTVGMVERVRSSSGVVAGVGGLRSDPRGAWWSYSVMATDEFPLWNGIWW